MSRVASIFHSNSIRTIAGRSSPRVRDLVGEPPRYAADSARDQLLDHFGESPSKLARDARPSPLEFVRPVRRSRHHSPTRETPPVRDECHAIRGFPQSTRPPQTQPQNLSNRRHASCWLWRHDHVHVVCGSQLCVLWRVGLRHVRGRWRRAIRLARWLDLHLGCLNRAQYRIRHASQTETSLARSLASRVVFLRPTSAY